MERVLVTLLFFSLSLSVGARELDGKYKKSNFKIGTTPIHAYIADNDEKRAEGLMYISKLPEDTGMLFVFDQEEPLAFWMKNTLIPLSIGFFDRTGTLVDVQEMEPARSMVQVEVPTYRSKKPATFALEMNKGWFAKRKVAVGSKLSPVPRR
jgi:uncharacterized membrane protein (UPF0127 family)